MQFIYPKESTAIFLPKDFDSKTNDLILKIAHSKPETTIYWYINEKFIGSTNDIHDIAVKPNQGKHLITAVDEFGNEIKRFIKINN